MKKVNPMNPNRDVICPQCGKDSSQCSCDKFLPDAQVVEQVAKFLYEFYYKNSDDNMVEYGHPNMGKQAYIVYANELIELLDAARFPSQR